MSSTVRGTQGGAAQGARGGRAEGHKEKAREGARGETIVSSADITHDTSRDRPVAIRHRRRNMRNAPMDIPDPQPD